MSSAGTRCLDPEEKTEMLTRTERLERLPMTREHGKLLGASGVGWALDAMDVGLISFVIVALGQQWGLDDATKSWVVSIVSPRCFAACSAVSIVGPS